jgi:CRP-like cAMP-binding protein
MFDFVDTFHPNKGYSWFVVLAGCVSVNISNSLNAHEVKEVSRLYPGTGFGDLALLNDQPRTATILSKQRTFLLRIDRADYERTIKFSHERTVREKMAFLRKSQPFCAYSTIELRRISELIRWVKHPPNTILQNEGDETNHLSFIRSGLCEVSKGFVFERRYVTVKLGYLKVNQYFGQWSMRKNEEGYAPVSIRTKTHVEVGMVNIIDAIEHVTTGLPFSEYETIELHQLPHLYKEQVAKEEYLRFKRSFLTQIIREQYRDPNLSLDNLQKSLQKHKWQY